MPQDIMHVLFEGVLQLEVHLMLKHFLCVAHYFTLDTLNTRIDNFAYSRTEARNRPPKSFTSGHITGSGKLPLSGMRHTCTYMHTVFSVTPACVISYVCMYVCNSGTNVDICNTPSVVCWRPDTFGRAALGVLSSFASNCKTVHS